MPARRICAVQVVEAEGVEEVDGGGMLEVQLQNLTKAEYRYEHATLVKKQEFSHLQLLASISLIPQRCGLPSYECCMFEFADMVVAAVHSAAQLAGSRPPLSSLTNCPRSNSYLTALSAGAMQRLRLHIVITAMILSGPSERAAIGPGFASSANLQMLSLFEDRTFISITNASYTSNSIAVSEDGYIAHISVERQRVGAWEYMQRGLKSYDNNTKKKTKHAWNEASIEESSCRKHEKVLWAAGEPQKRITVQELGTPP
ncbi:hypothetical protein DL93DRAFT_2102412 [Clavulina sp. PMI_390]|nr:hypothetical protein DL93DRAFT_2102412 [Clavulina sp. PMI_390]